MISQHLDWPERNSGQKTGCWLQDRFRCRRTMAERGMRSGGIAMAPPCFDQHLRLAQRRKDLAVEQLVAKLRVEALAVAVRPKKAWLDEECFHADAATPFAHGDDRELRAIVGTNVLPLSVRHEQIGETQIGETMEHVVGSEAPGNVDRQESARGLFEHDQHAEDAPSCIRSWTKS